MTESRAAVSPPPPRGRRRRVVVDPAYQLGRGLLVGAVALVLLALLNIALVSGDRIPSAGTAAPVAAATVGAAESGLPIGVLLLGSALFLAAVVFVAILDSHRTAGASYAIRRTVEAVREGRTGERVRLRKNDHLKGLAEAVNRLAETIDAERARHGG